METPKFFEILVTTRLRDVTLQKNIILILIVQNTSFHVLRSLFSQFFVRLDHIRKCFTQKGGIFVLEEYSEYSMALWTVLVLCRLGHQQCL